MIVDKIFRIIADSLWNSTIQVHKVDDKNNVSFVDMARSDYLNQIKDEIKLTLWNNALNGAKYMYQNCGYDFDSGAMDEFLQSIGCNLYDKEFINWFYEEFYKWLDCNEE